MTRYEKAMKRLAILEAQARKKTGMQEIWEKKAQEMREQIGRMTIQEAEQC